MNTHQKGIRPARAEGFTLVELMVVVLVISLLAAIAVPGYRNHVVKTQRAAAKACLAQYASLVERLYTTELTYENAADLDPPGCASEDNMPDNYTLSVPTATLSATAYVVQAAPTTTFAARDTQCGTLTLNQQGVRGVTGEGTPEDCW